MLSNRAIQLKLIKTDPATQEPTEKPSALRPEHIELVKEMLKVAAVTFVGAAGAVIAMQMLKEIAVQAATAAIK